MNGGSAVFSVCFIPHAKRVETFTHYELIKEWRQERMCKALWCPKSHQEWFEIAKEQAAQVLGDWADLLKKAEPYDSKGSLETQWRKVIEMMDGNGEVVIAKKLLEHYEASLVEEATLIEEPVDLGHAPKIGYGPKVGLPGHCPKRHHCSRVRKQIPLMGISLPKAERHPKSDPLFKWKPLPRPNQYPERSRFGLYSHFDQSLRRRETELAVQLILTLPGELRRGYKFLGKMLLRVQRIQILSTQPLL